jgi:hypothetical protein
MSLEFSIFRKYNLTKAYNLNLSESKAVQYLLNPRSGHNCKSDLPLWSPTTFTAKRNQENARLIHWVVYDLDDGLSKFESWELFAKAGLTVVAHTSFSHTEELHKYRIALPLVEPIPAKDWPRAYQAAIQLWDDIVGVGKPDQKAISDSARAYYQYAKPPNDNWMDAYYSCALLDLNYDHIPEKKKIRRTGRKRRLYTNGSISLRASLEITEVRESIACTLGATITGNTARKITCPSCGRESVFFSLDLSLGNTKKYPSCNHLNSCGWYGTFEQL